MTGWGPAQVRAGGRVRHPIRSDTDPLTDAGFHLDAVAIGRLPAGPAAAGMPPLITPPAMPTPTSTASVGLDLTSDLTIGANEVRFFQGTGFERTPFFLNPDQIPLNAASIINLGWIWSNGNGTDAQGVVDASYGRIDNAGTIVANADRFATTVTITNQGAWSNSGSIYALSNVLGLANAVLLIDSFSPLTNSGLIAARSVGAVAIGIRSGGALDDLGMASSFITNTATGAILAQGYLDGFAVAIEPSVAGALAAPTIRNDGRIEAISTGTGAGFGILVESTYGPQVYIVNSGTIRADFAIYSDDYANEAATACPDTIVNQATGRIEGLIFLGLGEDVIDNAGLIHGDILMDEQADRIANTGRIEGFVDFGGNNDLFDNAAGIFVGIAEMGWNKDSFIGGTGADTALGGRHEDDLKGNDGNDLLLGGLGADRLEGGAGNDGVFGEQGADVIVTKGGDYVSAGLGDDRIEAGDLAFEMIDGGSGFDTLVLPAGPRKLDLSAALAEGALASIEAILLRGGQELVVRPADVPLLAGGAHRFYVAAQASDRVDLVGAWSAGPTEVLNGIAYRVHTLGAETVLVQTGVSVTIGQPAPADATGLDPFPGGELAPLPVDELLSSEISIMNDLEISNFYGEIVEADEIWRSDDGAQRGAILVSNVFRDFTNYGRIESVSSAHSVYTAEISGDGDVRNYGSIIANGGATQFARALDVVGSVMRNDGLIESRGKSVAGFVMSFVAYDDRRPVFFNHGEISAYAKDVLATGVLFTVGSFGAAVFKGENSGTIRAFMDGHGDATGVELSYAVLGKFTNSGLIEPAAGLVSGPSFDTHAYGMSISGYTGNFTLENSGTIRGTVAVRFAAPAFMNPDYSDAIVDNKGRLEGRVELSKGEDTLTNSGVIIGAVSTGDGDDTIVNHRVIVGLVELGAGKDSVTNSGVIAGGVDLGDGDDSLTNSGTIYNPSKLGAGNDSYDGRNGIVAATIDGGVGNDRLMGGFGGDRLTGGDGDDILQGGAGDDRLAGGTGNDYLQAGIGTDRLEGGVGVDLFVFTAPADSRGYALRSDGAKLMPDMIADFTKGVDKIDLRGIDAIAGTAENDAFTFLGTGAFTHQAGQVRYETAGGFTSFYADVDGDGAADLQIVLLTPVALGAADFIL